jgi:Tol biopolymer transport system component
MVMSRSALSFIFRLGVGCILLVFALLLAFRWIGQNYPSPSMVYINDGKITIYDTGRGIEARVAGDYALWLVSPNITPVTSPDGRWIAAGNSNEGVRLFDLAQRTQVLLPLDFDYSQLGWSPDSRYVVTFSLKGAETSDIQSNAMWMTIEVGDVRSGEVRKVVPPYQYLRIWSLGWSSDNQQITFVAMTTPTPDYTFYRVNIDGSDFHELNCAVSSGGTEQLSNFNFAPGAEKVTFSAPYDGLYHLYVLDFNDCSQTQISDGDRYDDAALWSPDGTRLAFLSGRGGQLDIYVMDADGQHVSRLTDTPENEIQLSWSPDSQRLLFISYSAPSGVSTYYYADLRDNSLHPFGVHQGYTRSFPAWGP